MSPLASAASSVVVSDEDAARWVRWLLPLPHEIRLDRKFVAPRGRIKVTLRPGAGPVERQAAEELATLLGAPAGEPLFTIRVGIQDVAWREGALPQARRKRLEDLPNRDQPIRFSLRATLRCC